MDDVEDVPLAKLLIAFADAIVNRQEQALDAARQNLVKEMGTPCMVDAAGVVANFQRMVRIADASGIPLDTPMQAASEDVRAELGINDYVASANTRAQGPVKRLIMNLVAPRLLRHVIRKQSNSGTA